MFHNGSATRLLRQFIAALIFFGASASCFGQGVDLGAGLSFGSGRLPVTWLTAPPDLAPPSPPVYTPPGPNSPIGTWEISIRGTASNLSATGIGFITFTNDAILTGYGVTPYAMFTLSGSWGSDAASGQITAYYTENLNGETLSGTFTGTARAGKLLRGSVVASNGKFNILGNPAGSLPDLSGPWVGSVTEARSTTTENYNLTPVGGYPGVFEISGAGSGPDGQFDISGAVLVTSKGNIAACGESAFQAGGTNLSYVSGKYNFTKQTATLNGSDSTGFRIQSKISRGRRQEF